MKLTQFIGGLGDSYQGAVQGAEDRVQRTARAEDREFLQRQRALQESQQQRALEEQARADRLRDDVSAVKTTRTVDLNAVPNDDDGNAMPAATVEQKRPRDEQLFEIASAYRKAGHVDKAMQLEDAAGKIAFQRSAANFSQLAAGADKLDVLGLAKGIGEIFEADPSNGGIKEMVPIDGGVRITIRNKDTGATSTREFVGPTAKKQLLDSFTAYYQPENWQKLQEMNAKAAIDRETELIKNPTDTVPKGYYDNRERRFVRTDTDGPAGSGTGAGASKVKTPQDELAEAMEFITKNTSFKDTATPAQAARFQTLANQILMESKVKPAVAAEVAADAALNPDKIKPTFDPKTGEINATYAYQGGNFVIERLGTASKPRGVTPEQVKSMAAELIDSMDEQYRPLVIRAAVGPQGREALVKHADATVRSPESIAKLEQRLGRPPTEEDLANAARGAVASLDRTIEMVQLYGDDKVKRKYAPPAQPTSRVPKVGGLGVDIRPGTPEELAQRARDVASRREASEKKSAEQKQAKAEAEAADKSTRAKEVEWLTKDVIQVMRPSEARKYYPKYQDVLSSELANELRKRL